MNECHQSVTMGEAVVPSPVGEADVGADADADVVEVGSGTGAGLRGKYTSVV